VEGRERGVQKDRWCGAVGLRRSREALKPELLEVSIKADCS